MAGMSLGIALNSTAKQAATVTRVAHSVQAGRVRASSSLWPVPGMRPPTAVPRATPSPMATNAIRALENRAVPQARCPAASSRMETVRVRPGTRTMSPERVVTWTASG